MKGFFKEYQEFTPTTAIYPKANTGDNQEILYLCLGLQGELVEWDESRADETEAGDVLYYISQLCNVYNLDLGDLLCEDELGFVNVNIAEALKKMIRDDKDITETVKQFMINAVIILKEHYSCMHFATFCKQNTEKLASRKNRGLLQGDGSYR